MNTKELYETLMHENGILKDMDRQAAAQKKVVDQLRDEMIAAMELLGTSTFNGTAGVISLRVKPVPTVTDWNEIYQFIYDNDAIDILQKRLSVAAFNDRLEEGDAPTSGFEMFQKSTLTITPKKG